MKILALILAAGEGSRIKHLLSEDEPVKAMLKVDGTPLIQKTLGTLAGLEIDRAVLSFPSEKYDSLNNVVRNHGGVELLFQKAPHKKLPTMLELPFILLWQYHLSGDKKLLQSYDAIITLPCDLIFENADLAGFVQMYQRWEGTPVAGVFKNPLKRRFAVLSKKRQEGGRCDLIKKEGERIMAFKKFEGEMREGWVPTTQAGVYIFSKGMLKNPLGFFLGFKRNLALQYIINDDWRDFGDPDTIEKMREGK